MKALPLKCWHLPGSASSPRHLGQVSTWVTARHPPTSEEQPEWILLTVWPTLSPKWCFKCEKWALRQWLVEIKLFQVAIAKEARAGAGAGMIGAPGETRQWWLGRSLQQGHEPPRFLSSCENPKGDTSQKPPSSNSSQKEKVCFRHPTKPRAVQNWVLPLQNFSTETGSNYSWYRAC